MRLREAGRWTAAVGALVAAVPLVVGEEEVGEALLNESTRSTGCM